MKPSIVKLEPPSTTAKVVACLENALEHAKAGEYETIFLVAFTPNGMWVTVQRGKRLDPLRAVGVMESIKADILEASSTDEPSGL